jgi:hypothetical protein
MLVNACKYRATRATLTSAAASSVSSARFTLHHAQSSRFADQLLHRSVSPSCMHVNRAEAIAHTSHCTAVLSHRRRPSGRSFTLSCGLPAPLCNAAELSPHCVAASDARIPSFVVEAEAAFEQRVIAENAFSVLRARGARASHQSAALPLSSCRFPMACASHSL